MFVHGARSVAMHLNRNEDALGSWANQLESRAHHNFFIVALADKLAGIGWAILTKENIDRPLPEM